MNGPPVLTSVEERLLFAPVNSDFIKVPRNMANESFGAIVIGFCVAKLHCSIALTETGLYFFVFLPASHPLFTCVVFSERKTGPSPQAGLQGRARKAAPGELQVGKPLWRLLSCKNARLHLWGLLWLGLGCDSMKQFLMLSFEDKTRTRVVSETWNILLS